MNARVDMKVNQAELAIAVEKSVAVPNYAPIPVVLDRGEGSWLWDADGKRYLDFMSAYSAVSHGHAHPRLVAALTDQAQRAHWWREDSGATSGFISGSSINQEVSADPA